MYKINTFFILLILFLSTNFISAADFTVQKLPNGQTVVICENHSNPIVTIDTWIKTGSINETDANNGISHFLEHLFFKGTKTHPTGEINRLLESKGAIVNAATSKDYTHYYITIPSEDFDTALELHSDMLLNPQIPRKELEQERKVVLEEISKDGNNPSNKVFENLNSLMFTTHPYKRKIIGTAENVETMRREEILEYFNKYYAPSNMITIIIGDVDTQKTMPKIQNAFNEVYKKPIKKAYKKEPPINSQREKIEYSDIQTGYMMIGFRGVPLENRDTYALDLLATVLGNGKSSILNQDIKEQKGLAYTIFSSNLSMKDDGIFYIKANFIPQNIEKLEKQIFDDIAKIQKYGITDEELNIAKNKLIQNIYYSRESTSDIASEIGHIMVLTGTPDIYNNYIDEIKKVSAASVQNAAKKYLGINKSAVSILLPNSSLQKEVKTEKKYDIKKVSEKSGIAKYEISNGATILINENKTNDIIAMTIIAKGGEFIENIAGEGTLAKETLLKGTKKYSATELAQFLEENGIDIKSRLTGDFFIIDIKTTIAQIDNTLNILDEILNNATFDEYEIERTRSEILSKIKQKRDIPKNIANENFEYLIFENSVYSHNNKFLEKTLPTVSRSDVVNYYNKILDAKNVIVSINGDVNAQKITEKFSEILKDKNAKKVNYSDYKVTKLNSPKIITKTIKDLQTAWYYVGWQTSGIQNKEDFVTLKIMNTILGSGLSSRLYKNLRESDGLAYQLGSNYTQKMLSGTFYAYIGTKPSKLEHSKNKIMNEINRLKIEFVSDTELKDAKDRLKGGFILALETNSNKAYNIGLFEAYGIGYDFLDTYIKIIDKISASDIIKVANKYFSQNMVQSEVK